MSIKLCQAANSVVTPLDDAQFYSWIANRAVGVVAGCAVTSAGTNQLSIAAGWGIVQGHVFTVGAQTISAAVAPSGTVDGRLLIRIDTSDTVTPVEFITQAETPLPALTQEDIDGSGSIYELPLAAYEVGTISISGLTNVAPTADAGFLGKTATAENSNKLGGQLPAYYDTLAKLSPSAYSTAGITFTNCSHADGGYVKIGKLVIINMRVAPTAAGSNLTIATGLPAPLSATTVYVCGIARIVNVASSCYVNAGALTVDGAISTGGAVSVFMVYFAA